MSKATKYRRLEERISGDSEIALLNNILDRLEIIGRELAAITFDVDQMRMEKENALQKCITDKRRI